MSYQRVQNYTGSLYGTPRHSGIEYDWEVPDTNVVASPGGVSSVHHHWTKGLYGSGDSSGDLYAGQGQQYLNSQMSGNMYNMGHTSAQRMGHYPEAVFDYNAENHWRHKTPGNTHQNYTEPIYENYTGVPDDYELLEESDEKKKSGEEIHVSTNISLITVIFLAAAFLLIMSFWSNTLESVLRKMFHEGRRLTWEDYAIYAIISTIIFLVILHLMKIPSVQLKLSED